MCRPTAVVVLVLASLGAPAGAAGQAGNRTPLLLGDPVDVSRDFRDYTHAYYVADALAAADPALRGA